ncbi:MAG TPA: hypothetical protein VGI67_12590 [Thermoleophilaceae bacterium]|jgi:hypothetical protein
MAVSKKSPSSSSSHGLVCPSCGREFVADERFCDDCRMPLVPPGEVIESPRSEAHERARKVDPRFTRGPLVRVAGAAQQPEAEMIQGLLLEHGVPSVVRRSAGFDVPDFLAAGPRDIVVPESGVETARRALYGAGLGAGVAISSRPDPRQVALVVAGIFAGGGALALLIWAIFQLA